jgi:DNA repair protein RadC
MKYAARTVTWRFHESHESIPGISQTSTVIVNGPEALFNAYLSLFKDQVKERFVVFWLSAANKILGFEIVSEGTLNASIVHPREVFRGAIVSTSAAIIVAHNHPSGNSEPSQEDVAITRQLADAGKIIGIQLHDHVVFTDSGYTSFAERGMM